MIGREDMMAKRDELMERREELMQRADELRERFAEGVDDDVVRSAVGWTLVSAGMAFGVTQWFKGRRGVWSLLLPVGMMASGFALLGGSMWHRRGERIGAAEMHVREELAALDPVARFQVLREVSRESVPFVRHSHN